MQDQAFSNRPAGKAIRYLTYQRADMAFAHYGPFWRQMRKLCVMRLFSRRRSESWESVRDKVDSTVRFLANRKNTEISAPVNVGELVFNLTTNIIFRAAFGSTSNSDQSKFISILQEFSKLFGAFNIGDFFPFLGWMDLQGMNQRLEKARGSLDQFIDSVIDDHIRNPKPNDAVNNDMVDDMIAFLDTEDAAVAGTSYKNDSQSSFKITKNNMKAIIMDVMFGGTETVASAIEWAMAELLKSPEDMKKVQQELCDVIGLDRKVDESDLEKLPFFKCCMKETLRLHPPIPLLLHETAQDCEVAGYSIPARSRIMVNVWAIGRDKSAWKDADTYHPARFESSEVDFRGGFYEFIPFGSGRRSCPGMQLGLYGLEMTVAQLLHCFTWQLPDGMKPSELEMGDVFGLTAPLAVRLKAIPTPRLNCSIIS